MDEVVNSKIAVFGNKKIRNIFYKDELWFSVVDIIEVLTVSTIPRRYWADLKRKLINEGFNELYEKIVQLKVESLDGKKYLTDCANNETLLRIIQTVPSPKVEPFKRWLAKRVISKENYLPSRQAGLPGGKIKRLK